MTNIVVAFATTGMLIIFVILFLYFENAMTWDEIRRQCKCGEEEDICPGE